VAKLPDETAISFDVKACGLDVSAVSKFLTDVDVGNELIEIGKHAVSLVLLILLSLLLLFSLFLCLASGLFSLLLLAGCFFPTFMGSLFFSSCLVFGFLCFAGIFCNASSLCLIFRLLLLLEGNLSLAFGLLFCLPSSLFFGSCLVFSGLLSSLLFKLTSGFLFSPISSFLTSSVVFSRFDVGVKRRLMRVRIRFFACSVHDLDGFGLSPSDDGVLVDLVSRHDVPLSVDLDGLSSSHRVLVPLAFAQVVVGRLAFSEDVLSEAFRHITAVLVSAICLSQDTNVNLLGSLRGDRPRVSAARSILAPPCSSTWCRDVSSEVKPVAVLIVLDVFVDPNTGPVTLELGNSLEENAIAFLFVRDFFLELFGPQGGSITPIALVLVTSPWVGSLDEPGSV